MNRIILITYRNSHFRDTLKWEQYDISEFTMPVPDCEIACIDTTGAVSYLVMEVNDENISTAGKIFGQIDGRCRTVCLIPAISGRIKSFLLEHGISDIVEGTDPNVLAAYLKSLETVEKQGSKILILEDNLSVKRILENIITAFDYMPVFHLTGDEVLESLKLQSVQLILINLGLKNFDLNGFIRKSCMRMDLKKIPLIAYKNMKEGILVHEVISGLNRLTKFILDTEELYSFLLDVLFRKKTMELVDSISKNIEYQNNSIFARDPLSQIYFSQGGRLFELDEMLEKSRIVSLKSSIDRLMGLFVRAEGLLWLKKKPVKKRDLTIYEADV